LRQGRPPDRFQHNRIGSGFLLALDRLQKLRALVYSIVLGKNDFRADPQLASGGLRALGLRHLEIILVAVKRNQESERFHRIIKGIGFL
jgi:hypothetical protein